MNPLRVLGRKSSFQKRCAVLAFSLGILTLTPFSLLSQTCTAPPSGLVGWWQGEGDTSDALGLDNGVSQGSLTFTGGEVGQAFHFDGNSAYISVPASSTLNIGAASGFTIECWINPADVSAQRPIVEWNRGLNPGVDLGTHFWLAVNPPSGTGSGSLYANIIESTPASLRIDHIITSASGLITANSWQHVAVSYDKSTGLAKLYLNGTIVAQQNLGIFTPQTT